MCSNALRFYDEYFKNTNLRMQWIVSSFILQIAFALENKSGIKSVQYDNIVEDYN